MVWKALIILCLVLVRVDLALRLVTWVALTILELEIAREALAFSWLVMARETLTLLWLVIAREALTLSRLALVMAWEALALS